MHKFNIRLYGVEGYITTLITYTDIILLKDLQAEIKRLNLQVTRIVIYPK